MNGASAEQIIDALEKARWPLGIHSQWGVEGIDIPGTDTYVNSIDTHVEGDYIQWYLIEVCTNDHDATLHYMGRKRGLVPSATGETWVKYLAVCTANCDKWYYAWHQAVHPFFDRHSTPVRTIREWFLGFVERTPPGHLGDLAAGVFDVGSKNAPVRRVF